MSAPVRQRVDLWLHRARIVKTRADATRLVGEGGVRLVQGKAARRLEKPSAEIGPGDVLLFVLNGRLVALRVLGVGPRRGPPAEARQLYSELDADALA